MNSDLVSLLALGISLLALWYGARAVWMKVGVRVRGSFSITSSIACEDNYLSHVTLHNLKDRAVVILKVFLEVSNGYFIEVDDFESEPLILRPFEAWHREYEPIERYSVSSARIHMNELLGARGVRRRLVLATAEGRYVVRNWLGYWDPVADFFKNHSTAIIRPERATFRGTAYGSNAKYVVEFTFDEGKSELVPIYPFDVGIRKFTKFQLTAEALSTKEALEQFLLERAVAGDIVCTSLVVHDLEAWRQEARREREGKSHVGRQRSWLTYNVLGRAATWWWSRRNRREHLKRQGQALQQAKERQPPPSHDAGGVA